MTVLPMPTETVREALAQLRLRADAERIIVEASVSGLYRTSEFWRVCVMVNGRHVFQPRFRSEAEAGAYREGAEAILDRAT